MNDIHELAWANEAFGGRLEATNLWIGGNESVTSFHKVPAPCIPAIHMTMCAGSDCCAGLCALG